MRARPSVPAAGGARRLWVVLAVLAAGLAVASVVVTASGHHPSRCEFDDGVAYCRMARGRLAAAPFSRRVVVPALVSAMPAGIDLGARFRIIGLLGAIGTAVAAALLVVRILGRRRTFELAGAPALLAGALVLLAPDEIRLALTAPVLTDQAATFLGIVWCLLVTSRAGRVRAASVALALLLIPTREAWMIPLLLAAGVIYARGQRGLAVATVVAVLVGAAYAFARPSNPVRYSTVLATLHWTRLALERPDRTLWALFFGVGLVSGLALLRLRRVHRPTGAASVTAAVACGQLLASFVGGADHARLFGAALPFTLVLATATAVELGSARSLAAIAVLVATTAVLWRPFRVAGPGVSAYSAMYYPGASATLVAVGGVALVAAAVVWCARDA